VAQRRADPTHDYLAGVNTQRRVLSTLGLERLARNVTPLDQYLRMKTPQANDDVIEAG
jgi:hypothetical protein